MECTAYVSYARRYYLNGGDAYRLKLWIDTGANNNTNSSSSSGNSLLKKTRDENRVETYEDGNDDEKVVEKELAEAVEQIKV